MDNTCWQACLDALNASWDGENEDRQKQPLLETLEDTVTDETPYDYLKSIMANFSKILAESTSREQQKKLLHMLISEITINEQREIESIILKINDSLGNYMNSKKAYPY